MKVKRIVRSKYLLHYVFLTIMMMMLALGYIISGYLPFGVFGEPDPVVIFAPVIADAFIAVFWFRDYVLLITDKVLTRLGIIRVHSEESVSTFDPLDFMKFNDIKKLSPAAMADLTGEVRKKYGPDAEPEQKHMREILMPVIREFRDREYEKYLSSHDYDKLVHGVMIQECREDGGNRLFGRRGARTSGNAVLVNPVGMVRQHGTDAVCVCEVENYWGLDIIGFELQVPNGSKHTDDDGDDLTNQILIEIEQREEPDRYDTVRFQGLPHYIVYGVLAHNPWFKLGDHLIEYGTEQVPECVRALVQDNIGVTEFEELQKRPRYVWDFPGAVIDLDPLARIQYIQNRIDDEGKSIKSISDYYGVTKKVEEKATGTEPEPVAPVPANESDEAESDDE